MCCWVLELYVGPAVLKSGRTPRRTGSPPKLSLCQGSLLLEQTGGFTSSAPHSQKELFYSHSDVSRFRINNASLCEVGRARLSSFQQETAGLCANVQANPAVYHIGLLICVTGLFSMADLG